MGARVQACACALAPECPGRGGQHTLLPWMPPPPPPPHPHDSPPSGPPLPPPHLPWWLRSEQYGVEHARRLYMYPPTRPYRHARWVGGLVGGWAGGVSRARCSPPSGLTSRRPQPPFPAHPPRPPSPPPLPAPPPRPPSPTTPPTPHARRNRYCKDEHGPGACPWGCKTCHFCRQRTTERKTRCCKCEGRAARVGGPGRGYWCGSCLWLRIGKRGGVGGREGGRAGGWVGACVGEPSPPPTHPSCPPPPGENIDDVRDREDWVCPACREICNCRRASEGRGGRGVGGGASACLCVGRGSCHAHWRPPCLVAWSLGTQTAHTATHTHT